MIAVYSALFGPYDAVPKARYTNSILFTDQPIMSIGWEVRPVKPPHLNSRYASRYYFSQSCKVLPEAEYTIMHGANAQLEVGPESLIQYLDGADWACCAHPQRDNVYDEAKAVIRLRKDKKEIVNAQMDRYRQAGFKGDDLSALALVVRRNTPELREFESCLWYELLQGSHRDQLAFEYVRWVRGFEIARIPGTYTDYLKMSRHTR